MKVGFIGLGKLGRDAAEVLAEKHDVVGYDPNVTVDGLSGTLEETCKDKDVVLVAVQTPHDPKYGGETPTSHLEPKDFDYSYLIQAVKDVDALVDKGTLISVISTVLPGTVRREILPLIKNGRFIYNPYLIAQGTVKWDMRYPEMIMIGTESGKEDGDSAILRNVYDPILEKPTVRYEIGTWEEIEALKVFYNTFITTKLCLVNMIQDVAMKVGNINVDMVTDALKHSTQRIMGPSYMMAGFGDGGACHPRDNIALRHMAKNLNLGYDLFDSIMKVREQQAENMARYVMQFQMPVVILGKAFKPGIDQTIGSPSMLVGWYIENLDSSMKVYYDEAPDDGAFTYLIHDKGLIPEKFNPGSCIVDPYRSLKHSDATKHCVIKYYGNTRTER
jgi:UDPglucose 6-dehydrogenase